MNSSFYQLLLMNVRLIYRNPTGLFFTLVLPVVIYIALSILPIGKLFGGGTNYSNFVLPGIIAMTVMQGGIYGLAYWMIDLKSRNVIKRFLVTPVKQRDFIASVLISRIFVSLVQAVFITLVGLIFFNATIGLNIIFALGFVILGSAIFLLVGLLISTIADSYEAAAPITSAIGLPLTFLGNIFYPVESLPGFLKTIANVLPITHLSSGIRSVYEQTATWGDWAYDGGILLVWLIGVIIVTMWVFKLKE